MKTAAFGIALSLASFGALAWEDNQPIRGEIYFGNNRATGVTNLCTGQGLAGKTLVADLYWAPDGVTNESSFVRADTYWARGPVAVGFVMDGFFSGGSRFVLLTNSQFVMCQVRVWEAAFGASYEEALANSPRYGRNAWAGKSLIFRVWPWPECHHYLCPDPHPPNLPSSGLQPFTVGDSNCLAPGGVLFESSSNTLVTNLCTGEAIPEGMGFLAGLYYAPDGLTNESTFTLLGAAIPFGPEPGQFHGGARFPPPETAPGQPALFQVRVWESAFGATYEEALAAVPEDGRSAAAGKSAVLRLATSLGGLASPATALASNALQSFYVGYPGCVAPGSVLLQNSSFLLVTNLCTAEPVVPGTNFLAMLYCAPDGETNESLFTPLGEAVGFGPEPGRFHGGLRFPTNGSAPGQFAMFQTRVWESAFGATYEEALAATSQDGRHPITGKSTIVRVPSQPEGLPLQAPAEAGNSGQPFYIGAPDCNAPGRVLFQNSLSTLVTNACTGQPLETGTNFLAALYYAPAGVSNDALFVQLGESVGIGPQAGRIQGGPRVVPTTTPPGASATFQVRVWESEFGATYEQAIAAPPHGGRIALSGKSALVSVPTRPLGGPEAPAETIAGAGFLGFKVGFPLFSVDLANTSRTLVYSICTGLRVDAGSNVLVALYHAPADVTDESLFTALGPAAGFGPAPGQFQGGPQFLPRPLLPGEVANLQVRVWESAFGSTYEQALAAPPSFGRRAMTGKSVVVRMRNAGECPAVLPATSLAQAGLQAFYLGGSTCEDIRARFAPIRLEFSAIGFRSVATGRVNLDPLDDAVALDSGSEYAHVLISRGDGSFSLDPAGSHLLGGAQTVGLGDFDGDSRADLLATIPGLQEVRCYLGRGDGTFGPALTNVVPFAANGLAVGDFDGDANLDVVTANSADSSVALFLGTGDGHFAPPLRSPLPFRASKVAAEDLDGDCRLDLMALREDDGQLVALRNSGRGDFSVLTNIQIPVAAGELAMADLNGDGQSDLATVNAGTSSLAIHLGDAGSNFVPIVTVSGLPACCHGYVGIAAGDFNGDGKPDILMGDSALYGTETGWHSYYFAFLNQTEWPRLTNDHAAIHDDKAVLIDVLANDSSAGVPLTIRSMVQPAHGVASIVDGTNVLYLAGTNFSGTDTFSYSLYPCDPARTNTATVTVTVAPRLHIGLDGGSVNLHWTAIAPARLWTATNLNPTAAWTPLSTSAVLTNNRWRVTVPFDRGPSHFFRLQTTAVPR